MRHKTGVLTGLVLVLLSGTSPLGALDAAPDVSTEFALQLSSFPEAKITFARQYVFPLLQGSSPLTRDNNLRAGLSAELSPVSINGGLDLVWTPIAFFQAAGGFKGGSGWNIPLFGSESIGWGINHARSDSDPAEETTGSAFGGLLWSAYAGGALQFDLAALVPGAWNHVVVRGYQELRYKGNTGAGAGESWYVENDDGENRNGFILYGAYVLGYQMPLKLNMAGVMAEMTRLLYDTPERARWGDDLIQWTFSGLANYVFTEKLSAALILQFRTRRNYSSGDEDTFYQRRILDESDKRDLKFYRAALLLTYRLR
jgi:hypothetical protein